MAKLMVSIDGVVIREMELEKGRTTLGRRANNDIVIEAMAISGEHVAFKLGSDGEVEVEDMESNNGTFVNGKRIKKQPFGAKDVVEIGKYKVKLIDEAADGGFEKSAVMDSWVTAGAAKGPAGAEVPPNGAAVKIVSGAAAGREVLLVKEVTTFGKPGVAVTSITRKPNGFYAQHLEGPPSTLNGDPLGPQAVALRNGDLLHVAGTKMQFVHT